MNRALLILGVTALGCAAAAMYYHGRFSDERARTTRLETRVAQLEQAVAARASPSAATHDDSTPTTPSPSTAAASPVRSGSAAVGAAALPARLENENGLRERLVSQQRALMNDPEYREAMRLQRRMGMNQAYPDLARELGLTSEQADRFLDLLTEQRTRDEMQFAAIDASDAGEMAEVQQKLQERGRGNEAEIAQLIGTDGLQRWQDYQHTIGSRARVRQLNGAFDAAGVPLSQYQHEQLRTTLAERDRQGLLERQNEGRMLQADASRSEMLNHQERELDRRADNYARSRAAVSHILSPEQMNIYQRLHESELTMQRAQLRIQRATLAAQGSETNAVEGAFFVSGEAIVEMR